MTTPDPMTDLDLSVILAKGWADHADFPDAEFAAWAEAFSTAMRAQDKRLHRVRTQRPR